MLQWGVRQSTETENLMTSVERLMEYTRLEDEPKTGKKDKAWPKDNSVVFKSVNFSYNGVDDVLKNIDLQISPGEKIGIVGRTGAGKSSLTTALFRLRELREGNYIIFLIILDKNNFRSDIDWRSRYSRIELGNTTKWNNCNSTRAYFILRFNQVSLA